MEEGQEEKDRWMECWMISCADGETDGDKLLHEKINKKVDGKWVNKRMGGWRTGLEDGNVSVWGNGWLGG